MVIFITMPVTLPSRKAAACSIAEHAVVRLRRALPKERLRAGEEGTVVHVYAKGAACEVEFVDGHKRPKLVTLEPDDIELCETD